MEIEKIKQKLKKLNLNLDPKTLNTVPIYLIDKIGFICDIEIQYQIYGALAILSQNKDKSNIDQMSFLQNGIKIQNIMSHLGKLSKEQFLKTLNTQLEKIKKPPQHLKKRVKDIRYSYRFYKKFQTTFEALFDRYMPDKSCKQDFNALFWILYLYIKNSYVESDNITQAKSLMILFFRAIFEKFIFNAKFDDFFFIIQQKIGAIPQISVQKEKFYLSMINQKMDQFYSQRFFQQRTNFNKLIEQNIYLERLVDDMSNSYSKQQKTLKNYNQIDELSFLQLKKDLTPQVFRRFVLIQNDMLINTRICFDQDENLNSLIDIEEPQVQEIKDTPLKKAHFIGQIDSFSTLNNQHVSSKILSSPSTPKLQTFSLPQTSLITYFQDQPQSTPISKKIHSQMWINQKIISITKQNKEQLQNIFDNYSYKSLSSQQFNSIYAFLKQKILQSIKEFTPKCNNYNQRVQKILSFFISNFIDIKKNTQSLQNQNQKLSIQKNILGVAALSCQIFNYINNAISYEFKFHFEVFEVDIDQIVQVFELFEKFISGKMPHDLKTYLHNIQKKFFVYDLWQNQKGFKLLSQFQNAQKSQIRQKINTTTQDRIKQICREAKVRPKITSKIINIMKYILENKSYLLKYNNIDQMILCCIMGCLSINQKQEKQTLSLLFSQYNSKIKFSFHSNKHGLKDSFGNQMKIFEYYNEVFLNQIRQILSLNQEFQDGLTSSPVKITQQYLLQGLQQDSSKGKKRSSSKEFIDNPEKPMDKKMDYRKLIFKKSKQILEMKEQNDEEDEEESDLSPKFGTLNMDRTFSFHKDYTQ